MDYQGGGGGGFGGGGGGGQQSGGRARRSYDEQTIIPVTVKMALAAQPDEGTDASGRLQLEDGRSIYHVKLIGATRAVEDYSTNVVYQIEDGTGLVEVKQWLDDSACAAVAEMRQQTLREHIYVQVIGQIKDFDGKKMIIADSVRPLATGNQITHHMLEVVYSAEKSKRKTTFVPQTAVNNTGVGFGMQRAGGAPLASSIGAGDSLREAVINFVRNYGEQTEMGASVGDCARHLNGKYSEAAIRQMMTDLCIEGHIYSTVDEDHYKFAM